MAWLSIIYHHVLYWVVGTTPEAHHANLAYNWYKLDRFQNSIKHCQEYLTYEDSDQVRAVMAYCQAALGYWDDSRRTYRAISTLWTEPSYSLGLAEAELRCGNGDEARKIVATVEVCHPDLEHDTQLSLERLHGELARQKN